MRIHCRNSMVWPGGARPPPKNLQINFNRKWMSFARIRNSRPNIQQNCCQHERVCQVVDKKCALCLTSMGKKYFSSKAPDKLQIQLHGILYWRLQLLHLAKQQNPYYKKVWAYLWELVRNYICLYIQRYLWSIKHFINLTSAAMHATIKLWKSRFFVVLKAKQLMS